MTDLFNVPLDDDDSLYLDDINEEKLFQTLVDVENDETESSSIFANFDEQEEIKPPAFLNVDVVDNDDDERKPHELVDAETEETKPLILTEVAKEEMKPLVFTDISKEESKPSVLVEMLSRTSSPSLRPPSTSETLSNTDTLSPSAISSTCLTPPSQYQQPLEQQHLHQQYLYQQQPPQQYDYFYPQYQYHYPQQQPQQPHYQGGPSSLQMMSPPPAMNNFHPHHQNYVYYPQYHYSPYLPQQHQQYVYQQQMPQSQSPYLQMYQHSPATAAPTYQQQVSPQLPSPYQQQQVSPQLPPAKSENEPQLLDLTASASDSKLKISVHSKTNDFPRTSAEPYKAAFVIQRRMKDQVRDKQVTGDAELLQLNRDKYQRWSNCIEFIKTYLGSNDLISFVVHLLERSQNSTELIQWKERTSKFEHDRAFELKNREEIEKVYLEFTGKVTKFNSIVTRFTRLSNVRYHECPIFSKTKQRNTYEIFPTLIPSHDDVPAPIQIVNGLPVESQM